jgi:hypothetical protein
VNTVCKLRDTRRLPRVRTHQSCIVWPLCACAHCAHAPNFCARYAPMARLCASSRPSSYSTGMVPYGRAVRVRTSGTGAASLTRFYRWPVLMRDTCILKLDTRIRQHVPQCLGTATPIEVHQFVLRHSADYTCHVFAQLFTLKHIVLSVVVTACLSAVYTCS